MRHERLGGAVAEGALARALVASAWGEGLNVTITAHEARRWASATFTGARHTVTLRSPRAPALGGWIAALPEATFAVRGHLVADLVVEGIDDDGAVVTATLAVLTIEEN